MAITVRATPVCTGVRTQCAAARPNRSRQIATILVRNGFGFLIGRVNRDVRVSWGRATRSGGAYLQRG